MLQPLLALAGRGRCHRQALLSLTLLPCRRRPWPTPRRRPTIRRYARPPPLSTEKDEEEDEEEDEESEGEEGGAESEGEEGGGGGAGVGPADTFTVSEVKAEGLPAGEGIPTEEDLFSALNCTAGEQEGEDGAREKARGGQCAARSCRLLPSTG